jgi:hypothetical protein
MNTQTWYPARVNISRMERAMVNLMATLPGVSTDDVLDCLVPKEELTLLRAATPHAELSPNSYTGDQKRDLDFPFGKVTLYIDFVAMKVIPPRTGYVKLQADAPKAETLRKCMETTVDIVKRHNKLRTILQAFDRLNVTPGAARHYWPTLQSLLPSDHAYFSVKGDRFRDVPFDYETTCLLREAPEIVAKGLLCEPMVNGKDKPGRALLRLRPEDSDQVFALITKE